MSWWPFRHLQAQHGLHPLWCTAFAYGFVLCVIVCRWPHAPRLVLRAPALWWLMAASGCTNAFFNWAVSIGDVVRVVLLFYLMPLWSVLLARVLLHERLSAFALLRVALALAGAAIVLKPAGAGWPLPSSVPDWLAVAGGFTFALNTVLLRREAHHAPEARAMAMFSGSVVVALVLAAALAAFGALAWPPAPRAAWVLPVLGLGLAFLASNLALQYGAARLRASVTSVVMLTEVVFATVSAVLFGEQELTARMVLGGALIVFAAALSAWEPAHREPELVRSSAQMAPTVLRDGSFRLFFFSREETRIHVHVAHPDGEAKFWLTPAVALANYTGFSQRQLREAQAVVEAHLEEVSDAWNRHFGC